MISKIKPNALNFGDQMFNILEFCKVCGIDYENGKNYKNIKNTIKTLADKSMWIDDNGVNKLFRWISEVDIYAQSGMIRVKLQDNMKPHLLQLHEHFTQYELIYALAMKSQYSIRMYELFKSYEYRQRCKFDIDELKHILFAEKYSRFPDFKRKVLDISMREINELTDITVTYQVIKNGRKYIGIDFSIRIKKDIDERMSAWSKIDEAMSASKHLVG